MTRIWLAATLALFLGTSPAFAQHPALAAAAESASASDTTSATDPQERLEPRATTLKAELEKVTEQRKQLEERRGALAELLAVASAPASGATTGTESPPEGDASATASAATTGTTAPTAPAEEGPATVSEEAAELTAEIELLDGALEDLAAAVDDLETALLILDQQRAALDALDGLRTETEVLEQELEKVRAQGPEEKPPYSILLLDEIRDELEGRRVAADGTETTVSMALAARDDADDGVDEAEAQRRKSREAMDGFEGEGPERLALLARLAHAKAGSELAQERLQLRDLELAQARAEDAQQELRIAHAEARHAWVAARARFDEAARDGRLEQLTKESEAVAGELAGAQKRLADVTRGWSKVRAEIQRAEEPTASQREEERARRLEIRLRQLQVSYLNRWKEWVEARKEAWGRRYRLATEEEIPRELIERWTQEVEEFLEGLERERRLQNVRQSEVRKDLLQHERSIENAEGLEEQVTWWEKHQRELREKLLDLSSKHLDRIEEARRDHAKLAAELEALAPSLLQDDVIGKSWETVETIWNFELTSVDDRPITVGKVLTALLLLVLGYGVALRGSRALGAGLRRRFGLDEGSAAPFESLAFYVLLLGCTLFALQVANVPLTAFTFIGGALAIGIGFGSQHLINNFISGVFLLFERPIRVGDLVEVEGTFGKITRIGGRCTCVRTPAGIDMLIPNSRFLDSNVVNWTLGDARYRLALGIGVGYASDPDRVETILREVVEAREEVLRDPAPLVLFQEFGASSLDYQVEFWVDLSTGLDRRHLLSQLRKALLLQMRAADIEIPFPQRDLNFPATVRVAMEQHEGAGRAGGEGS